MFPSSSFHAIEPLVEQVINKEFLVTLHVRHLFKRSEVSAKGTIVGNIYELLYSAGHARCLREGAGNRDEGCRHGRGMLMPTTFPILGKC